LKPLLITMVKSNKRGEYTVSYNTDSHFSVITQVYGSIWKDVLAYCILNTCICFGVYYLRKNDIVDLTISDWGHNVTKLFVSFLVVTRVNMALSRYNQSGKYLNQMYSNAREFIQNICAFTRKDQSEEAKEWRHEIAYNTCMLLRLTMAVIDYEDSKIAPWKVPELTEELKKDLCDNMNMSVGGKSSRWTHGERGEKEEGLRVPIRMAYIVRKSIWKNRNALETEFQAWEYGKLFASVDHFMNGYYGQRIFLTTPFPFPLVQMARTFLFLWVFTLPMALLSDASSIVDHCCIIFFVTYGFIGLESVSIQLDNPFGEDENDFDNLGMAYTAFEDTYATIHDVDGNEWTDKLRHKMIGEMDTDLVGTEREWLLGGNGAV